MSATPAFTLSVDDLRSLVREEVAKALKVTGGADEAIGCFAVAKLLGIHPKTAARWARTRGLPGRKVGGEWRFVRAAVMRWLQEKEAA